MGLDLIPIANLAFAFLPGLAVVAIMYRWGVGAGKGLYANARMLVQLVVIGYVLTYVFEADNPWVIVAVLIIMTVASAWIAMRPLQASSVRLYLVFLAALGSTGFAVFWLVTQLVLEVERWFEPSLVVPIAGMIFANTMNTVSLTAERYEAELGHGVERTAARRTAFRRRAHPADQQPARRGSRRPARHDDRANPGGRRPARRHPLPDRGDVHGVRRGGPRRGGVPGFAGGARRGVGDAIVASRLDMLQGPPRAGTSPAITGCSGRCASWRGCLRSIPSRGLRRFRRG